MQMIIHSKAEPTRQMRTFDIFHHNDRGFYLRSCVLGYNASRRRNDLHYPCSLQVSREGCISRSYTCDNIQYLEGDCKNKIFSNCVEMLREYIPGKDSDNIK